MQVVTDYVLAKKIINEHKPCFFANYKQNLMEKIARSDYEQHVIGRKFKGLFDNNDGSYVTITKDSKNIVLIDRDSYGSIPLYYSTARPIVSTDIRLIIEIEKPGLDDQALCEYLSTSYLTGNKTIYNNIHVLMPNQTIILSNGCLSIKNKAIFPSLNLKSEKDVSTLLEEALQNSLHDFLQRFPGKILLNLSGGTDSTLLLAKIKEIEPQKPVITTTFFHEDWRDDLNDWEYAAQASEHYGSIHHLIKINNVSFTNGHSNLVTKANYIFHTYATAFYLQNQIAMDIDDTIPIVNGSGPDESMIGTEKIAVTELLSLNSLKREEWQNYLIRDIDYIKIPEEVVVEMLHNRFSYGFTQQRRNIAVDLLDTDNFVEFQRRYHALTVLQDHIRELTFVAQVLDRPIIFPYLTNDIFRIIFSSSFESLNTNGIYKSEVKKILAKYMPTDFVHRKKIGFQSPSRAYFKSNEGLGLKLSKIFLENLSKTLNLGLVEKEIKSRLNESLDLYRRYDFLEWTVYNILFLEKLRRTNV